MTANAMSFLQSVTGFAESQKDGGSADRPIKLAVIDPSFDPSEFPNVLPKVQFEGESTISGKFYAVASPYWPHPGDKVWMVPVGSTYLIVGSRQPGIGGVYVGGQVHIPNVRRRIVTDRLDFDSSGGSPSEFVVQSIQSQLSADKWYEVGWETEVGTVESTDGSFIASIRQDNVNGLFLRRRRQPVNLTSSIWQVKVSQLYQPSSDEFKTFVATISRSSSDVFRHATPFVPSVMYIDYVEE